MQVLHIVGVHRFCSRCNVTMQHRSLHCLLELKWCVISRRQRQWLWWDR